MSAPTSQGSPRGHGKSEHGGKPVGTHVKLPRGAADPIKVYINGHEQKLGLDYNIVGGEIVFKEPILKEDLSELNPFRKVVLGLGLVGSYQRDETVDVEYSLEGKRQFASDLAVIPDS
ncbi:MAG: hypothetical protein U0R24_10630 [Solirubrobacterales bacterium]